jgi:hypothetical protein
MRPTVLVVLLAGSLCAVVSSPGNPPAAAAAAAIDPDASPEELRRQQGSIERHLLRVQQERFESRARGDDSRSLKRLDREFQRTYGRRNAVIEELRKKTAAE